MATAVPSPPSSDLTPAQADLEAQSTALLASLPLAERRGILLPHQLRDRQRRERELSPVLAVRDGGSEPVMKQWESRDELLSRADLSPDERAALLLQAHHGFTDQEIADLFGQHRVTITSRRRKAIQKVRAALETAG